MTITESILTSPKYNKYYKPYEFKTTAYSEEVPTGEWYKFDQAQSYIQKQENTPGEWYIFDRGQSYIQKEESKENEIEELKVLISPLNKKEKNILLKLISTGNLNKKDITKILRDEKNNIALDTTIYNIPNLSDESKDELLQYIKENNLSKNVVKAIINSNSDWFEIERIIFEYFTKEREKNTDFYLNIWAESQKAQKTRLKFLCELYDDLGKIDAEIAGHRIKTNQEISELYYKALFD